MKQKSKPASRQLRLLIDSEVVRQIRQHGRSSTKAEVCGVLIGHDRAGVVEVEACITGLNAEEAGAHVTFTQDTWEHIYKIKDKEYPEHRIVGWYHTHPGFGVFLSDHDTFIHNNFFSSPGQVAWVFDPHSDEEGCFGWVDGSIERLSQIAIVDGRGGEPANQSGKPEPSFASSSQAQDGSDIPKKMRLVPDLDRDSESSSLQRLVTNFFSYLTVLLVGFLLSWFVFPRVVLVPVPVDPLTGRPLPGSLTDPNAESADHRERPNDAGQADKGAAKGDNAKPK
jgi:proteasome lid subunit RPN8/RPN11